VATLTVGQVLALGRKHGFTNAELPDLFAVTTTESGNRTDARQAGGKGRGLVQIDLGQHPNVTEAQALDPDFAMAYARKLYLQRRWAPWYGPGDNPRAADTARAEARRALAAGSDKDPSILARLFDPRQGAEDLKNLVDAPFEAVTGAAGNLVADGIRSLFPFSLVKRVLLIIGGAGLVVIGATALGADAIKAPNPIKAAAKIAKKAAR